VEKCTFMHLTENMILNLRGLLDLDKEELCVFAEWLLRVGNGVEHSIQIENESRNKYIKIHNLCFCLTKIGILMG
jgi:ATP-dependent DNA helicase PIF1